MLLFLEIQNEGSFFDGVEQMEALKDEQAKIIVATNGGCFIETKYDNSR